MKLHMVSLALRLLWSPNTETDFSHYIVFTGENPYQFSAYQTTTDTFFSPLENDKFYAVRAVDQAGNVSDFSEITQFKAQGDTMFIDNLDTLTIQLIFSSGILPTASEFETLQVEHRWKTSTYTGDWWPLLSVNKDYSLRYLNQTQSYFVDINIPRLKSFLDQSTNWTLEIRAKFPSDSSYATSYSILILRALEKARLIELKPIER